MRSRPSVLILLLAIVGCTHYLIPVPDTRVRIPGTEWIPYPMPTSSWHSKVNDCTESALAWLATDEKIGADYCKDPLPGDGLSHCGKVEKFASTSAFEGSHVLRVSANDAGVDPATPNNHVIAYRRVADSFVTGWWRYRFAARIPAMRTGSAPIPPAEKGKVTGIGQTGPEFSLQNSRFEPMSVLGPDIGGVRLISYICGLQYLANTWDPDGTGPLQPDEGHWNIWIQKPGSCNADWHRVPAHALFLKLERNKWYHFEFTVNFNTMRYGRFVIRDGGPTGAVLADADLSCHAVFGEWKWKDPPLLQKFEMSLEAEDQYNKVENASVEQYEVHYDCAHLSQWLPDEPIALPPHLEAVPIDLDWLRYQHIPLDWPIGPWPGPWPGPDPLPYYRR